MRTKLDPVSKHLGRDRGAPRGRLGTCTWARTRGRPEAVWAQAPSSLPGAGGQVQVLGC